MTPEQRLAAGEGDYILYAWADATDQAKMDKGCHYNYRSQKWEDGHDHAHYLEDSGPLYFCGSDVLTCTGDYR